MVYNN
ncbi:Protein of unknown function, partial [Gryllus bimaculatus]